MLDNQNIEKMINLGWDIYKENITIYEFKINENEKDKLKFDLIVCTDEFKLAGTNEFKPYLFLNLNEENIFYILNYLNNLTNMKKDLRRYFSFNYLNSFIEDTKASDLIKYCIDKNFQINNLFFNLYISKEKIKDKRPFNMELFIKISEYCLNKNLDEFISKSNPKINIIVFHKIQTIIQSEDIVNKYGLELLKKGYIKFSQFKYYQTKEMQEYALSQDLNNRKYLIFK